MIWKRTRSQIQGEIQAPGGFSRVYLPSYARRRPPWLPIYLHKCPTLSRSSVCPTASGSSTQSHPSEPEPTHGATLVPPLHVLPSEFITSPTFSRAPPPHCTLYPHSGKCTIIHSGVQERTQSFQHLPLSPTHIQPVTKHSM